MDRVGEGDILGDAAVATNAYAPCTCVDTEQKENAITHLCFTKPSVPSCKAELCRRVFRWKRNGSSLSSHAHIMCFRINRSPSTNGTVRALSDKVGRVQPIWPQSAAPVNVAKYISSTASVLVPGRLRTQTPRPDNDARQSTKQVILVVCTCSLCWPKNTI